MAKQLPDYPGQNHGPFSKKPEPPKFLEVSSKDGSTKIIKGETKKEKWEGKGRDSAQPLSRSP